jgi:hypothetical protein
MIACRTMRNPSAVDVVRVLLEAGATPLACCDSGKTVLHDLCWCINCEDEDGVQRTLQALALILEWRQQPAGGGMGGGGAVVKVEGNGVGGGGPAGAGTDMAGAQDNGAVVAGDILLMLQVCVLLFSAPARAHGNTHSHHSLFSFALTVLFVPLPCTCT